jgi:hypothetical protein
MIVAREESKTLKPYSAVCKICDNISTYKDYCTAHRPYAAIAEECAMAFNVSTRDDVIVRYDYQTFKALDMYKELSKEARQGICFLCALLMMGAAKRAMAYAIEPLDAIELLVGMVEAEYL